MTEPKKPIKREDRPGHLDPAHAAKLRELSREEHAGTSSDPAPRGMFKKSGGDGGLAEELGEQAVLAATSGEDSLLEGRDTIVDEERGGPFVETTNAQEMAGGTDASNPKGADREPFPKT